MDPALYQAAYSRVQRALNDRYMLAQRVEREGLKRVVVASVLFLGYKFVKLRFFGRSDDRAM